MSYCTTSAVLFSMHKLPSWRRPTGSRFAMIPSTGRERSSGIKPKKQRGRNETKEFKSCSMKRKSKNKDQILITVLKTVVACKGNKNNAKYHSLQIASSQMRLSEIVIRLIF
mmetsp:Transcript_13972/g.35129  ORF Transcript_13972/g.35129 Transcript_13972/m.35129 type:complete len:112 (-) Transcript_13972:1249-1584(-)